MWPGIKNVIGRFSTYFLLSDDAQDEITERDNETMKCRFCGHQFLGEFYDSCPECFSSDTEEVLMKKTMDTGEDGSS